MQKAIPDIYFEGKEIKIHATTDIDCDDDVTHHLEYIRESDEAHMRCEANERHRSHRHSSATTSDDTTHTNDITKESEVSRQESEESTAQVNVGTYCTPRIHRRQRNGSYPVRDAARYPTRELRSLRVEGPTKTKLQSSRSRVSSGESRDSEDYLDDASHLSTCATSDYAFMSSMDTLNLSHSFSSIQADVEEREQLTAKSLRPLSVGCEDSRDEGGIMNVHHLSFGMDDYGDEGPDRKGHSDSSENCQGTEALVKTSHATEDSQIFGCVSYTNGEPGSKHSTLKRQDNEATKVIKDTERKDSNTKDDLLQEFLSQDKSRNKKRGSKTIGISEDNLVSRVSRWLSGMKHSQTQNPDTFSANTD